MLPGLSNLTNRLRYYGFYCWLLGFYFEKEKKGNQTEQYRFIRRAELLIAFLMQTERKSVTQITGSLFASNRIKTETEEFFDLSKGADKNNSNKGETYWEYSSGAFGQYYLGALGTLSLVIRYEQKNDVIFKITQLHSRQKVSGEQLAEAFDKSLTDEIKSLFYNSIKNGKLQKTDIPELIKYFAIDKVDPKNPEWQHYVDMLLDKDDPSEEIEEKFTFHRKNTILSLLSIANRNDQKYDWKAYLDECYKQKLINSDNTTDIDWYCYRLNEYWQYACGLIFYGMLCHLECLHEEYLPKFITSFSDLIKNKLNTKENTTLENYISSISENENDILKQGSRLE